MSNQTFKDFLLDDTIYSINTFDKLYSREKFVNGFVLYRKYTRKDVLRILNWVKNEVGLNVGGYKISQDESNCPIFVNYKKGEDISDTTKYADQFKNKYEFEWMTKSGRSLTSREIVLMQNNEYIRLPLFVKKSNDEGEEHYYMGDVTPIKESIKETTMELLEKNKDVRVVKVVFSMNTPVEDSIYDYITEN